MAAILPAVLKYFSLANLAENGKHAGGCTNKAELAENASVREEEIESNRKSAVSGRVLVGDRADFFL